MSLSSPVVNKPLFSRLLDLSQGFDRSWSFGANGVERRALFFLPPTNDALSVMIDTAKSLGFDSGIADEIKNVAAGADAIGMAISENGSVRLYAQYWDLMAARVEAGDLSPTPLYLGLKQYPDGSNRRDVYFCLPLAPTDEYIPVISEAMTTFGCDADAVSRLLGPLTPELCIWTRTQGEGRSSWLATVRRAEMDSQDMHDALCPISNRTGISEVRAALEVGQLLHIAGGTDSNKGDFLTLYVETDRDGMQKFLSSAGY